MEDIMCGEVVGVRVGVFEWKFEGLLIRLPRSGAAAIAPQTFLRRKYEPRILVDGLCLTSTTPIHVSVRALPRGREATASCALQRA